MSARGIVAWGSYLPRRRLPRQVIAEALGWTAPALRGKGERTIAAWDEDALTMAVEAARHCVRDGGSPPTSVWLASTTLPFVDRDNAAVLVDALNLPAETRTLDATASQRAGSSALAEALLAGGDTLVIASDCREARPGSPLEMQVGHGAAAMRVGEAASAAAEFLGHRTASADLVDHYRARGQRFDYSVEDRWVRDEGFFKLIPPVVQALLDEQGLAGADIGQAIFPCPARVAQRLAKTLGIDPDRLADDLSGPCGHTGTAQPLLLLARALEQAEPGQLLLLVGFGQGVDALLLRTTERILNASPLVTVDSQLAAGRQETSYLRYLAQQGLVPLDRGNRAEFDNRTALTALYRNRDRITGFSGGRCRACGMLQYPRARMCVNPECRALDTQDAVSLAGVRGRIKSFTEDWLAASIDPPLQYGTVELDGGAQVFLEFTDCDPGSLAIGQPVEMRFRIKDVDERRHFTRYFWKPAPVEES
ncbi:MAG: hydroxymethylglutaryl-CoA synthase family protein [Gammaproteobacteria bacterium]|nr:MAG: hydroxymethylglutaryl-CoA synthase family protein [Gammaproteobacteria bacterium]